MGGDPVQPLDDATPVNLDEHDVVFEHGDPGDEHREPESRLLDELNRRYPRDAPHTRELRDACSDALRGSRGR